MLPSPAQLPAYGNNNKQYYGAYGIGSQQYGAYGIGSQQYGAYGNAPQQHGAYGNNSRQWGGYSYAPQFNDSQAQPPSYQGRGAPRYSGNDSPRGDSRGPLMNNNWRNHRDENTQNSHNSSTRRSSETSTRPPWERGSQQPPPMPTPSPRPHEQSRDASAASSHLRLRGNMSGPGSTCRPFKGGTTAFEPLSYVTERAEYEAQYSTPPAYSDPFALPADTAPPTQRRVAGVKLGSAKKFIRASRQPSNAGADELQNLVVFMSATSCGDVNTATEYVRLAEGKVELAMELYFDGLGVVAGATAPAEVSSEDQDQGGVNVDVVQGNIQGQARDLASAAEGRRADAHDVRAGAHQRREDAEAPREDAQAMHAGVQATRTDAQGLRGDAQDLRGAEQTSAPAPGDLVASSTEQKSIQQEPLESVTAAEQTAPEIDSLNQSESAMEVDIQAKETTPAMEVDVQAEETTPAAAATPGMSQAAQSGEPDVIDPAVNASNDSPPTNLDAANPAAQTTDMKRRKNRKTNKKERAPPVNPRLANLTLPRNQASMSSQSSTSSPPAKRVKDGPPVLPPGNAWRNFFTHITQDDGQMAAKAREEVQKLGGDTFRPEIKETYQSRQGGKEVKVHEKVAGKREKKSAVVLVDKEVVDVGAETVKEENGGAETSIESKEAAEAGAADNAKPGSDKVEGAQSKETSTETEHAIKKRESEHTGNEGGVKIDIGRQVMETE
jgi:hypothetical protein